MRRDAVRQLRTVAGHQAAAASQEEAAGISGGQEAEARHPTDLPGEGVVILYTVVRNDRRRLRIGPAVPGAAVRGPGRVHAAGRFRRRPGSVHHGKARRTVRSVQLHVELVPRRLHQRRVPVQSHIRGLPRGCRRSVRVGSRVAGQHQGLRLSAGSVLRQLYQQVRPTGHPVSVPLFPAKPNAGSNRLRQAATVQRHRQLFRRPVHRMCRQLNYLVLYALRLSNGGRCLRRRTPGQVQEFRWTYRMLQRSFHKHTGRTTGRSNIGSDKDVGRAKWIMTILGNELLSA